MDGDYRRKSSGGVIMYIFFRDILIGAVYRYPSDLDKVAKMLDKLYASQEGNIEAEFINGYKNHDSNKLNDLIGKVFEKSLGSDRYSYEFEKYLKKFGIEEDLSFKSDKEVLKIVSSHRNEIKKILAQNGIV